MTQAMPKSVTPAAAEDETPLFWTGNCAKARVIRDVLAEPRTGQTIFDYGAGRGGDWPEILALRPDLRLVCYEPDEAATAEMRRRFAGTPSATVLTTPEFEAAAFGADVIISFSVFEHVHDRAGYIRHAKRLLGPSGVFHLNYDDGHFRTSLDLDERRNWRQNVSVTLQNRMAWFYGATKWFERYQSRVPKDGTDRMALDAGLRIAGERYENLIAMKEIWKTLPDDRRQAFTRFWIDIEDRLNADFRAEAEMRMGDTVNLWRQMGSRTLTLVHA